jgi:hypothetical protein
MHAASVSRAPRRVILPRNDFALVRADYAVAVRRLPLALTLLLLAGCGSSKHAATTTAPAPAERPAPTSAVDGTVLYEGGDWAVVTSGNNAVALRFRNGAWHPDRTRTVKIAFLGPDSPAPAQPQVAAELRAPTKLAESALWVDGVELLEKGGGLEPTKGTIYGAPNAELAPGEHVAVAYARTATAATAVTRVFVVR